VKRLLLLVALVALPRVAAAQQAETVEYYGSDVIGSIRIVFDAYGNVIGRQDFAPFGAPVQVTPPVPKEGFGGQEKDDESNQAYFHARMFEMRTGRFGAPDPIEVGELEPQRWNRYAYSLDAPLSFIDPDGLNACGAGFCSTSVPACEAFDCDTAGFFDGFYSPQDAFGDTFHESYSERRQRPTRTTPTAGTTQPGTGKPADPPSGGNPPPGNPPPRPAPDPPRKPTQPPTWPKPSCSGTNAEIVRNAALDGLAHLNPSQDETSNIQPLNDNFASVVNPARIATTNWATVFTSHGTAMESPLIPGQKTFAMKLYVDPKLGNTIAVVHPTSSIVHVWDYFEYELGVAVNAGNSRAYLGCPGS